MFEKKEFFRKKEENKSKFFQRSIYVCKDIKKYEVFTKYNLRRIRPGNGLDPKYYENIIGRKSPSNLKKEEPLNKSILKKLNISTK